MRIALFQMNIIWEKKKENYQSLEYRLKSLCEKIDLILLPEMSFTGFSMNTDLTKERNLETASYMTGYAVKYHTAIGFGWVKDCGEKSENHYTVVDKEGRIISDYTKIHPFSFSGEDKKFRGGRNIVFFELEGIKFSTFICYDLRFPEIFQIASKESSAVVVPANWPRERREHWMCLLQARAIENQIYILAVNCVGKINGVNYTGDSCIIAPDGKIISKLSGKEGILEYDLNDDVYKVRSRFPVRKDRKEDLYNKMSKEIRAD